MNTFGLDASHARTIADALAGAATASSADLGDLALGLQMAGQSAQMAGLSVFETAAALAAFADQGIRGSDAGTSFKTFLMRLNPTTQKARDLMREMGLNFFDSKGRLLKLPAIAGRLRGALQA
jgi:TP901 family phage tail tape measure protein